MRRDRKAHDDQRDELERLTQQAAALEREAPVIEDAVYDLKAVNPHTKSDEDARSPEELIARIAAMGREVAKALEGLKRTRKEPV